MVFLAVQKFISLIGSHLFVFAYLFCLGDWTQNIILESTLRTTAAPNFCRSVSGTDSDADLHAGSSLRGALGSNTMQVRAAGWAEKKLSQEGHTPASNPPQGALNGRVILRYPNFWGKRTRPCTLTGAGHWMQASSKEDIPFMEATPFIWGQFLGKNSAMSPQHLEKWGPPSRRRILVAHPGNS